MEGPGPRVVLLAALLAGTGVGLCSRPPADAAETIPPAGRSLPPSQAPLPADCDHRERALEAERARLALQIETARFRLALLEGAVAAREGRPRGWSADVAPHLLPETYLPAVERAVELVGGFRVARTDCAEAPCVVALAMTELPAGSGSNARDLDPVLAVLGERGQPGPYRRSAARLGEEGPYVLTFAPVGGLDDEGARRVGHRVKELHAAAIAAEWASR